MPMSEAAHALAYSATATREITQAAHAGITPKPKATLHTATERISFA